jgi:S-adenosyl methyltransferase
MTDQADGMARVRKFDASRPNVARIYDYLLGGKDHFAADRQAAQQLMTALPEAAAIARANRTFLAAAVRHVAQAGIAQYLDIGAGLPTSPSVHECARAVIPGARVAYVDSDVVAVTHAQALLATGDGVVAAAGDAREPEAILADPAVAAVIDLAEPVCVLLVSMLHFFTAAEADMIVGVLRQRMVPGSYLIISQGHASRAPREGVKEAYGSGVTLTGRPAAEIAAYFDGFDLVPPGLVPVRDWPAAQPSGRPDQWPSPHQQQQPQPVPAQPVPPQGGMLAGVGRKRA